jgi:hypothetical protein
MTDPLNDLLCNLDLSHPNVTMGQLGYLENEIGDIERACRTNPRAVYGNPEYKAFIVDLAKRSEAAAARDRELVRA